MKKKHLKFFPKETRQRGESLVEVMTAIAILSIVLFSAFTMLGTAMSTHRNIKNRVKAIDFAREGIELVRNLRDTNWLRYSGSMRTNWLCYTAGVCTVAADRIGGAVGVGNVEYFTVDATQAIDSGNYITKQTEQTPINLGSATDYSAYQLYRNTTDNSITHVSTGAVPTIFYRQVEITTDNADSCGGTCPQQRAYVTATVHWIEPENQVRTLRLHTVLYDFYKRTSYTE